jgi:hypothetical protein
VPQFIYKRINGIRIVTILMVRWAENWKYVIQKVECMDVRV